MDSGKILSAVVSLVIAILAIWLEPRIANLFRQSLILGCQHRLARSSKWTLTPAQLEPYRLAILSAAIFVFRRCVFWGAITGFVYVVVEWRFPILAPLLLQLRHASLAVREIVASFFIVSCLMFSLSFASLGLLDFCYQELRLHTELGREELKKELKQLRRKQRRRD